MREIIFRGKLPSGAWVYGDLRQYPSGAKAIKSTDFTSLMEVDPRTVGQYTGLNDKNGAKIFEGDILSACFEWNDTAESRVAVEWGDFRWVTHQPGYDPDEITDFDKALWVVIGNVYDNPELLEVRNG
jgi:uncharacterized phage protein (TIGR01671 family)